MICNISAAYCRVMTMKPIKHTLSRVYSIEQLTNKINFRGGETKLTISYLSAIRDTR